MYADHSGEKTPQWRKKSDKYDQNIGQPGVVYVLANRGLAPGWYKIGCTRHSGNVRAKDLNRAATTGTPGEYHCIFERRTTDCGTAERRVFDELKKWRRGKPGQEFFEIDVGTAKVVIEKVCEIVDSENRRRPPPIPTSISLPKAHSAHATSRSNAVSYGNHGNFSGTTQVIDVSPYVQPKKRKRSVTRILLVIFAVIGIYWLFKPMLKNAAQITSAEKLNASIPRRHVKQSKPSINGYVAERTAANNVASTSLKAASGELRIRPKVTIAMSDLTPDERQSLESSCERTKVRTGMANKDECTESYLRNFDPRKRPGALGILNQAERQSLEYACSHDKYSNGPTAYNDCRARLLAKLDLSSRLVNFENLSVDEKKHLDSMCLQDKFVNGPAAYNACVTRVMKQGEMSAAR